MNSTKRRKANLWRGLIAIGIIVFMVMAIGIFLYDKDKDVIYGEAEATEYRVSGKLPGRIEEYYFEEGDQVKKGDTLVFINSPEILALYQKAQVGVDITKKSFDRVQTLYEKNVVPQQKRDEVEAQYKAALATADAAKTQYDMAVNGAQREDIMAAQALVERAEGAVSEVTSYLDEINLVSPVDGEVTERFPKVGELVGSGSPIMSIVDLKDIWFTFNVREDQLKDMTVGTEIDVQVPALGDKTYKAKVTFMKAMMSYATWRATKHTAKFDAKTFEVKARPMKEIPNLRPGMTVLIVNK